VAALFALHPLNVESVAWVAERKNVLSMLFFLLAVAAYIFYARKPGISRYVCVAVLFATALAAKPMVIALPVVLLLLDWWPLQRIQKWTQPSPRFSVEQQPIAKLILEKVPLLVLSAASAVITLIAQHAGGSMQSFEKLSFSLRFSNAIYTYGMYLAKGFWPAKLAIPYPHPGSTLGLWKPAVALAVLVTMSAFTWKARHSRPYLLTGWLWFLITLVPVIGIVQVGGQAMADRYVYLPLIGIFLMVVWGALDVADGSPAGMKSWAIRGSWAVFAVLLAALSFLTFRQTRYWQSSLALWSHALKQTQNNVVAENSMAMALLEQGREDEAFVHFENAAVIDRHDATSRLNLGAMFGKYGRQSDAIREYEAAIPLTSDPELLALTYTNLGFAYTSLGDYAKASENYRDAIQADSAQVEEVLRNLSQYVAQHPSRRDYLKLGQLLEQSGRPDEAHRAYQEAAKLGSSTGAP
jgi:Tfp pilus assembly protein PilF